MNKLFILEGQSEGLLAVLQNDNSGKCSFFDAVHTEQLNKDHTFEFSVPADHEAAAHVKENNLVAFKDEDGDFQLFQIYKIEEEHNGTEIVTRANAEHAFFEMNDDIIEDLRTVDGTADSAMTDALSKSRFRKGTVADLGKRTTNFYYESAVSSIQKIIQTWGGELKKRIYFDGSKITGRFVDLLARRGDDTGKRFEFTKDLVSIKRTVDTSNLKTALYGRGKGEETEAGGYTRRIDFADVIWNGSGLDPVDKPLGQKWVGDPEALEKFGRIDPDTGKKMHRFGVFEDGEETDPEVLLEKTWNVLQSTNTPRITYEMNVLDLEQFSGLSHEKVRLGDTVFVIDKEFKPALRVEARVIEIKRDLVSPENTEIILGNFLPLFTDLASRLKNIESKVDGRTGIWDESGELGPIDDTSFADISPKKPNVTSSGAFSKVIIEWDADLSSYVKEYEVYVSTLPNFTPDISNLVARTMTSVFVYEGEPNQQYYIRVRGMNRAGTAGPFSDQETARTARIVADDITPQVLTNELIALNANIDGAKMADASIGRAKIGSVNADVIDTGVLNAARIDVRAQLGANISTAEELLYGYMGHGFLDIGDGENWYQWLPYKSYIYLMEDTTADKYNRPAPEEGDEIAFDFLLYAKNTSGAAPTLTATITVYFEGGGSWTDPFQIHTFQPVPANTPTRVQFSRKVPEGAYSGKKPSHFEMSFYTTTSGTELYVRDTDVRIRLRGNLIVQGDIEVKNLKAWEGLNVNDQFIVDENGNVKFAGTLEAGVSINSPTINAGEFFGGRIYMYGEQAIYYTVDDPDNQTERTIISNGSISQDKYETAGDYTRVRSTFLRSGRLDYSNGVNIRERLREDYITYGVKGSLLPYEYKYEFGDMIIDNGLIAADIVGVKDSLDGTSTGWPLYLHVDRLGIGKSKVNETDPEYTGLLLDIRKDRNLGNRTLLSTPDGITFKSINSGEFVFKDKVWIDADADLLQLYGSTHCYIEFFKTGGARSGWFGYGSLNNDNLNISNSIGRVIINTSDGGVAEFMGLSGHDGLRMANRAIIKWLSSSDTIQIRSSSDGAYGTLQAIISDASDRRLKRNILPYEESALEKVLATPIYTYNMIGHEDSKLFMGMIADEAPKDIVIKGETPDIPDGINLYQMSSMLWKAVQEMNEKLSNAFNEIEELKMKLERNGIQ
ncbi:phage tail spike protein [Cytobacillus oceanisediminis]|uniref:phage tail spike protein n=1 Tax=Cytobacillus oceanisediminis TaxID=665099 RepID=UPI0024955B69|nr:phage tail spike protein [Cytobacillus oceanisediminis]